MDNEPLKLILNTFVDYGVKLEQEFDHCLSEWPADLQEPAVHRVLTTLLARQVYFALFFTSDAGMWNSHTAALLLRPMLETHLKVCWIKQNPLIRCQGIARADLIGAIDKVNTLTKAVSKIASTKTVLEMSHSLSDMLTQELALFNADQKAIMVESREMANKVGGDPLTLYRQYHIRFSSSIHSTWNHIARFNLNRDPNPLHRYQFVAMFPEVEVNFEHALASAIFADKTLCTISNTDSSVSLAGLIADLEKIGAVKRRRNDEKLL